MTVNCSWRLTGIVDRSKVFEALIGQSAQLQWLRLDPVDERLINDYPVVTRVDQLVVARQIGRVIEFDSGACIPGGLDYRNEVTIPSNKDRSLNLVANSQSRKIKCQQNINFLLDKLVALCRLVFRQTP